MLKILWKNNNNNLLKNCFNKEVVKKTAYRNLLIINKNLKCSKKKIRKKFI